MGQPNFKKPFEVHSFSERFYCGMSRLRNTYLSVFIQCQYTRTILRKMYGVCERKRGVAKMRTFAYRHS